MKYKRQNKIIKIVKSMPIHTHDELIETLRREGFNITQATISRDIKELGLIKVPSSGGSSVYSVPEPAQEGSATRVDMVSDSVKNIVSAMHTIVINTYPGMASAVAAAVDGTMRRDILGSIAGDDTVLIITESPEKAVELERRMKNVFKAD
ncbi:MAG: arginine repressor [Oscillospiraceae bacterium]|nr:arginine repressor [Oscillospiraceae bacterium]